MKIVLADPPDVQTPWLLANHPNLGILYLSSYLKQRMKDVQIYYLEAFLNLKEHLKRLKEIDPDLYGISFSSLRRQEAFATIRSIKEQNPRLPVICGGTYPTIRAEEMLQTLPVDVCVRGEGEVTLAEVVEAFQNKRSFEDISGIVFRRGDRIVSTGKRELIHDLNTLPFPDWDLVDFANYKGNYQYMAQPSTVMIASRGCPYDCVFCANPIWKLSKPWLRLRSPSNICEEAALLYQKGVREISIRSDEFNPLLSWTLDVCREIEMLGLTDLFFQGNLRADKVTDELVREMRKCNFWLVQLGIESGNQRTLDGIGKHVTLEEITEACRLFKRHGIKVYGYIMIYNAWEEHGTFCYETPDDVDNTLRFVWRLKREGLIDYMSFSTTTPMPGSRLFDIAVRHKALKKDAEARDLSEFSMEFPGISRKAMKRSRLKGLLLQTFINLRSSRNCYTDWKKNWHKVKTFIKSV